MFKTLATLLLCLSSLKGYSQQPEFSFKELTDQRIATNKRGHKAYGTFVVVNIIASTGGFIARPYSTGLFSRPYYMTNAAWGVIQGITVLSAIKRTDNEVNSDFNSAYENYGNDISRYRSRIYLDIGMMAGGTVLAVFGKNFTVQDIGLATATQGVLLIFLDGIMYASHNAKMMKWAKAMRIHTSANSVGISYTF
ncbi:MAG: hypothetical protein K8F30_03955 [Taibaiella sp.]|nr:hypothetical protein [Taibaiella sp.]